MDRAEIVDLLTRLAVRLESRGIRGEMYVLGGAAIALAFDERRSTHDIDAVFEPKMTIYEEATALATEFDLPRGWLNDAVKGFLSGADPDAAMILDLPGLSVATASPRILLGLKVLAHRIGEDDEDVRLLARELGLTTADEVLDVAETVVGSRLDVAASFFVQEIFAG